MVLAAYEYVEERGSGSQSTSRPWPVTSSEWSGHGWTRCWSGRLPWRPLPPMHEATGAVASPLMPTRTGYGTPQLPHRPQHKPRPEQTKSLTPNRPHAAEPTRKALVTRESTLNYRVVYATRRLRQGSIVPLQLGTNKPIDVAGRTALFMGSCAAHIILCRGERKCQSPQSVCWSSALHSWPCSLSGVLMSQASHRWTLPFRVPLSQRHPRQPECPHRRLWLSDRQSNGHTHAGTYGYTDRHCYSHPHADTYGYSDA